MTLDVMNPNWERWIDVDFGQNLPPGVKLGTMPRDDKCGAEFDVFEDNITPIPRSQWEEMIQKQPPLGKLVSKVKDQDGVGSCAPNSATQTMEIVRNMQLGKKFWMELSPISVYWWVSGGRDRGSNIGENLRQLRDVGALPADTPSNRQLLKDLGLNPNHVKDAVRFDGHFPDGWKETAAHFRVSEWYDINTIEGFVTAVFLGYPVSYGRSAHAICAISITKRNGKFYIVYVNSWGQWGDSGFGLPYGIGYDSLDFIARNIPSYGAWCPRQVTLTKPFVDYAISS